METVLIIEANRQLSSLYSEIMAKAGFRVIQVYSCASALDYLRDERPTLIVIDSNLPDGSSLLITTYLRTRPEFDKTCIDMVSGNAAYKSQITFHNLLGIIGSRSNTIMFPQLN